MKNEYWLDRWQRGDTGFHQDEINPYLCRYWPDLNLAEGGEVFVPLCGKSRDMLWLRRQGYPVLGVELSAVAVQGFFDENGCIPNHIAQERFDGWEADGIRILCGDFFDLEQSDLQKVRAVYDRASLIALPSDMRERYVSHLMKILPPAAPVLLVTLDYPQSEMQGPPFSISPDDLYALYNGRARISLLAQEDVLARNPRFQERGLSRLQENIFLLTPVD